MSVGSPRIAVIGTGWWSTQHHIPNLIDYEQANLVALADVDEERLRRAADHFAVELTFTDPNELLQSGIADGVVIAVPHVYHYDVARNALDAGLHVLLEKPMVLKTAHAWDLVKRAERRGCHLMLGYTYQFTRAAQRVRDIIQSGRIGDLIGVSGLFASMVESYYRGHPEDYDELFHFPVTGPGERTYSDPAISGGGQGQTQVTHAMGMVLWATDRRVKEVSAFMSNLDLNVDLVDGIAFRMDNGAVGTMAATGSLAPNQPQQLEFRYYGSEGFVLQDLSGGTVHAYFNDGKSEEIKPLDGDEVFPRHLPSHTFVDLITGQGVNWAPAEPAARTVEFLEAAYLSAAEGRVVRTDELVGGERPAADGHTPEPSPVE